MIILIVLEYCAALVAFAAYCALSVNKPFKDRLRKGFTGWYAKEISKQMQNGTEVDCVVVDVCRQEANVDGFCLHTRTSAACC